MVTAVSWFGDLWKNISNGVALSAVLGLFENVWVTFFATFILLAVPYFVAIIPNFLAWLSYQFISHEDETLANRYREIVFKANSIVAMIKNKTTKINKDSNDQISNIKDLPILSNVNGAKDFFYNALHCGLNIGIFSLCLFETFSIIKGLSADSFASYQAIVNGDITLSSLSAFATSVFTPDHWYGWLLLALICLISPLAFCSLAPEDWYKQTLYYWSVLHPRQWSFRIVSTFIFLLALQALGAFFSVDSFGLFADISSLFGHICVLSILLALAFVVFFIVFLITHFIEKAIRSWV